MSVLEEIVARRRARVRELGHALRENVPAERSVPLLPFDREPFLIGEVKRRSPSRGDISTEIDPVEQAQRYTEQGARSISVLTEQEYFGGSLSDLMAVKERVPDVAVLRKDFLLDAEDLELSYCAGADAVLLIAAVLSAEELGRLHAHATSLGMAALVEIHDRADAAKAGALDPPPPLLGLNSRDLTTFRVDRCTPLMVVPHLPFFEAAPAGADGGAGAARAAGAASAASAASGAAAGAEAAAHAGTGLRAEARAARGTSSGLERRPPPRLVFESGVFEEEDAAFAGASGFDGLLVGEAVMRKPEQVPALIQGLIAGKQLRAGGRAQFWRRLFARREDACRKRCFPLVKICGIVRPEDGREAARAGADVLGFVFVEGSSRCAPAETVRALRDVPCLRVGVVVARRGDAGRNRSRGGSRDQGREGSRGAGKGDRGSALSGSIAGPPRLPAEVIELLEEGALDAVQLHGDEAPEECYRLAFPYYKAIRPVDAEDARRAAGYRSPRVLLDAYSSGAYGGTGERVAAEIIRKAAEQGSLWLAGGLTPENVGEVVARYRPELVDVSSGVESAPGVKDIERVKRFIRQAGEATHAGTS